MSSSALPPPARYTPFTSGRYDVAPALRPLPTDFGNGRADRCLWQFDREFPEYRANKLACRAEAREKYAPESRLGPCQAHAVTQLLLERLASEHPEHFALDEGPGGRRVLQCRLTAETLHFAPDLTLAEVRSSNPVGPNYRDAWDAIACQVQEDLAVVTREGDGGDTLAALHICSPTSWVPREKLGQDFVSVHAPVPGMESTFRSAPALLNAVIERGPFVRFVWGIAGSTRLNQHPEPPPGVTRREWRPPAFDPRRDPAFCVRVERQVLWGLPDANAFLFAIRLYRMSASEIRSRPGWAHPLARALGSMCAESREYKGIREVADEMIGWLGG